MTRAHQVFVFEQACSEQAPREGSVQGPLVKALNPWVDHHQDLARIEDFAKQVATMFQSARRGEEGEVAVLFAQHPELTILETSCQDFGQWCWKSL